MVTGDRLETAVSVARTVGLLNGVEGDAEMSTTPHRFVSQEFENYCCRHGGVNE